MVFSAVVTARRRAAPPPRRAPVPVIVVGNLVVGGAGKTPVVIALVQALQRAGRFPGVISRGHGRTDRSVQAVDASTSTPRQVGDEPLLIVRRTGVPVVVARRRLDAAAALCGQHPEVDVLVSDDGLQHQPLAFDIAVVVFDERGIGNGLPLPAGPLREPMPEHAPARWRVLYNARSPSTPIPGGLARRSAGSAWPLAAWRRNDASAAVPLETLATVDDDWLAVAGMAAPDKFFATLRDAGLPFRTLPLPDHHPYDTLPWPAHTLRVITTEKDAVKLDPQRLRGTAVWVLPLDLALPPGFVDEILASLPATPSLGPAA